MAPAAGLEVAVAVAEAVGTGGVAVGGVIGGVEAVATGLAVVTGGDGETGGREEGCGGVEVGGCEGGSGVGDGPPGTSSASGSETGGGTVCWRMTGAAAARESRRRRRGRRIVGVGWEMEGWEMEGGS